MTLATLLNFSPDQISKKREGWYLSHRTVEPKGVGVWGYKSTKLGVGSREGEVLKQRQHVDHPSQCFDSA